MDLTEYDEEFWQGLEKLVAESRIIIDRPKGSAHPRYPDTVYPLDYGYLDGTSSMDGNGIDVWQGSESHKSIDAVICILDTFKKDSEIKILYGCSEEEKEIIYNFHNDDRMKALMIRRAFII